MSKFIKLSDSVIRKDSIKRVAKYERDKYEGGTYYGIRIETETGKYNHEVFGKNCYFGDNSAMEAEQKRDEIYENIINQLVSEATI